MSLEEIKNLQGADVRKKNEEKILVNHIEKAWDVLYADSKQNDGSRVDIILDNAGFELYADLSLVLFLLDSKLAKNVILHPKNIPWFVSDVLPIDLVKTINYLKDSSFFPEGREQIDYFVSKLQGYLDDGSLSVRTSAFWTTPTSSGISILRVSMVAPRSGRTSRIPLWLSSRVISTTESSLVMLSGLETRLSTPHSVPLESTMFIFCLSELARQMLLLASSLVRISSSRRSGSSRATPTLCLGAGLASTPSSNSTTVRSSKQVIEVL